MQTLNDVLIPGDDVPVPKSDLKYEVPRFDVPQNWKGIYLWNLAK